jgi:diaminopimelate epimerase
MIRIEFTKASGAGNDFVIIDNRTGFLPDDKPGLARALCSRHFGVGGDGMLLVEDSKLAHFMMKYYNADGSYGGMCGNGGRCIARYAHRKGIAPAAMKFEALDHVYNAEVGDESVCLTMKNPRVMNRSIRLKTSAGEFEGLFVDTGSPHFVTFVADIEGVSVQAIGREIRNQSSEFPHGTNVDFVQLDGLNSLLLRTYERGVEAETLACGTGSVAAGVAAHIVLGTALPVSIRVRSGEVIVVNAIEEGERLTSPTLSGSAHLIFDGEALYDPSSGQLGTPGCGATR